MKKLGIFLLGVVPILVLLSISAMNPPSSNGCSKLTRGRQV